MIAATTLSLAHFVSEADALLSHALLRPPLPAAGRACARPGAWPARGYARRPRLRLAMSEEPREPDEKTAAPLEDEFEGMDESQRKFKAAAIRKQAVDLDEAAAELRKKATEQEQEAAKLRIQAWYVPCAADPAAARARACVARQLSIGHAGLPAASRCRQARRQADAGEADVCCVMIPSRDVICTARQILPSDGGVWPHLTRVKTNAVFCMRRKLEGGVSAVTKQVTVKDKYAKQLAELDLMAEDWVDTDEVSLPPLPLSPFIAPVCLVAARRVQVRCELEKQCLMIIDVRCGAAHADTLARAHTHRLVATGHGVKRRIACDIF